MAKPRSRVAILHRILQVGTSRKNYCSRHSGIVAYGLQSHMRVEETGINRDWINSLRDVTVRARIQVRVDRLAHGNPGQYRQLSGGVSELKIDVGPGYRVYYQQRGTRLILLLAGGDKSTQARDIQRAIELVRHFQE